MEIKKIITAKFKANKGTIWMTFILFSSVILIAVFDFYNIPTSKMGINESFITSFKPIFYLLLSLCFALIIFASQNFNSSEHSLQLKDAIEKIKPFQTAEIYDKIENWLCQKNETKFILFYFPFSFIPGFWINLDLFQKFQTRITRIEKRDNISVFFIGPDCDNVNFDLFLKALVKVADLDNCYKENNNNPIWAVVEFEELRLKNATDKNKISTELALAIKEKYKNRIDVFIEETQNKRDFVDYHIVGEAEESFWDNKPKFSFILRMLKTNSKMKFEIIINDTFELSENFQYTMDYKKIGYNSVLSEPKSYFLADENLSSLFISTILQSFMDDKKLKDFIDKNKIIT